MNSTRGSPGRRGEPASTPWWVVAAAVGVVLPFLAKAPVIDEEGYLWIARNLDVLRPYDWTRIWPPYADNAYGWAHPPLHLYWLRLWAWMDTGPVLRAVAGLPWILLFSAAYARLARHLCHHPGLAAALWLANPIVVLGLQDTWMIDLQAVALATAAVAAYREGLVDEDERWFIASGVALGLAIETKYTMGVLVPVLLAHMVRLGPRYSLLACAAGVVALIEVPLFLQYGALHPLAVWQGASEVASGGFLPRLLGVTARAGLIALPVVLLLTNPLYVGIGLATSILLVFLIRPTELPLGMAMLVVVTAAAGASIVVRAAAATISSPVRRRKGDRGDPLLLGGWFLAVFLGIAVFHNYASARYLLPAVAPAALMLTRSAEEVSWGKAVFRGMVGIGAATALLLAVADYRFAGAAREVARAALSRAAESGASPGRFAGEWTFRGEMEAAGWTRYRPDETLPVGTWVIAAKNSSPGELDAGDLEPIERLEASDSFPVRVVDLDAHVGLYAETLGVLPFGWGRGALETATLYRARP